MSKIRERESRDRVKEVVEEIEKSLRSWEQSGKSGQISFEVNFRDGSIPQKQFKKHAVHTIS